MAAAAAAAAGGLLDVCGVPGDGDLGGDDGAAQLLQRAVPLLALGVRRHGGQLVPLRPQQLLRRQRARGAAGVEPLLPRRLAPAREGGGRRLLGPGPALPLHHPLQGPPHPARGRLQLLRRGLQVPSLPTQPRPPPRRPSPHLLGEAPMRPGGARARAGGPGQLLYLRFRAKAAGWPQNLGVPCSTKLFGAALRGVLSSVE